jgi:spore coat protein U-like protein
MLGIHSQIGAALARLTLRAAFGLAGLLGLMSGAAAQSCSVTAASGSFGSLDVLPGTAVNSSSTFSASCTGTANRTVRLCIELGRGASAAGPSGERALTTGTNYLDFEFYSDAARTLLWGSWGSVVTAYGTGGVSFDLALGAAGSANRTFTVYSRVLAGQSVRVPGTYTWTGSSPGMIYGYAAAAACPTGGATTTSGGTTWTATVLSNCNVSVTPLNFGTSPSAISANLDSTATISSQCTNATPYSIGLSNGTNATGSQRRMRLGATSNYLNYSLYTNSARSNGWVTSTSATACSSGSGTCVLGTGTGLNQSVSIYGRVAPQTATAAGSFSDTVVVTITF